MSKNTYKISVFLMAALFFIAGCATTRARKSEPIADQNAQIADLQKQLQEKDQEIQDLQVELTSGSGNFTSAHSKAGKSSLIRVPGVSVTDVQSALVRAGFDPGPVDGHAGKKTTKAIKAFQNARSLAADGVVGEKTWNLLK